MLITVVSVAAVSARAPIDQTDRGRFDPPAGCRVRGGVQSKSVAPALADARTVFLSSEAPPAESGQEEVRQELQRWHRWVEVSRREAADVVLSTSVIHGEGGGTPLNLSIRARASGTVLWVSSGHDVAAAFKSLERELPSLDGACAPIQVL
jgi:uncharacterized membrane protein YdfJ with MMPL/SSD domain